MSRSCPRGGRGRSYPITRVPAGSPPTGLVALPRLNRCALTDEPVPLTAKQVAEYDQAWAGSYRFLTELITHWIVVRDMDADAGVPTEASVVGMSQAFYEDMPHDAAASALATAVVLLARMVDEDSPDE